MPAAVATPKAEKADSKVEAAEAPAEAVEQAVADESGDWKSGYDSQLAAWREEADQARAKAEQTRGAIEDEHAAAIQAAIDEKKAKAAAEREEKNRVEREARLAAALEDSPPFQPTKVDRTRVRDAWELVKPKDTVESAPPSAVSQWEEVTAHSSADISVPTSEASQEAQDEKAQKALTAPPPAANTLATSPAAGVPSLTLAIFTAPDSLTVSRVFAALGINLILPFINGIMLGLGEITAREGVREFRLWWKGERAFFGHYRRSSNTGSVGLSGSSGF